MSSELHLKGEAKQLDMGLAVLCSIPVLSMLFGGQMVQLLAEPGPKLTSAVQHFAAGLVFAAVGVELLPMITSAGSPSDSSTLAIVIGFLLGVGSMLVVGRLVVGRMEEAEIEKESASDMLTSGAQRSQMTEEASPLLGALTAKRGNPQYSIWHNVPWGLVVAAAVDSVMDGLLLGISYIAGAKVGWIMAVALTLEMFFLGISVSSTMRKRRVRRVSAMIICAILPALILCGSGLGALILSRLDGTSFLAMISFGVAALLYLVTDELMIEAHSDMKNDTWFVTVQFFLGFLLVIILDREAL